MKTPITVEIEAIDGAGKSSAVKYMEASLKAKGIRVITTREVGSTHIPVCVKLRELILDPNQSMDGKAMELVFAAMRIENQRAYEQFKNVDVILSDRGWLSHLAYNDHNVSERFTRDLYLTFLDRYTTLPDAVVFLRVDPKIASTRRVKRNEAVDAIEAKGDSFQTKVAESFEKYLAMYYNAKLLRPLEVDANGNLEEVQKQLDIIVDRIVEMSGVKSGLTASGAV